MQREMSSERSKHTGKVSTLANLSDTDYIKITTATIIMPKLWLGIQHVCPYKHMHTCRELKFRFRRDY